MLIHSNWFSLFCVVAIFCNQIAGLSAEYKGLENILEAKIQPQLGKDIFFLETSKVNLTSDDANAFVNFNARQACSVESTARHNPMAKVFVIFVSSNSKLSLNESNPFIKAIAAIDNVHIRHMNLLSFVQDTPINEWIKSGQLFQSK